MTSSLFERNKQAIYYGILLASLLFLLKWLEVRFVIIDPSFEIYSGSIAVLFTGLGVWIALKLAKPKKETVIVEKEIFISQQNPLSFDEKEMKNLGISKRELEVLQLIAEGLSNREIAARLFVSENTVKTHSSKLFEKLEVERRTQAVDKAKKSGLIA